MSLRPVIHILLHILVPALAARTVYPKQWGMAWIVMMLTLLVDLDHLFTTPIYDPNRCSIGFHPLHTMPAVGLYIAAVLIPKLRLVGIGLLIHMVLDWSDCLWMTWGRP
jgi:hypothetical protein